MLTQLTIENFGLIDRVSLEFNENLNILTGETGAGKSIVIDALRAALGHRLNSSHIRDSQKPCFIEAVFFIGNKELQEMEIFAEFMDEDHTLIIQRTLHGDNRQKIKVNGKTVTVGQLKEIGRHLIDFHGPHDHQMLLAHESHLGMLDRLTDFGEIFKQYQSVYKEFRLLKEKIQEIKNLAQTRDREIDMLSHQVKELGQVNFKDDEYEELLNRQKKYDNAERLTECVNEALELLDSSELSTGETIRKSFEPLRQLNQIDEQTSPLYETLVQLQDLHEQLIGQLHDYAQNLNYEPQEAHEVNQLCDIYDDIKRKYGPTLAEAREFYQQAKERYDLLLNLEHNDQELQAALKTKEKLLHDIAQGLTKLRKKTSQQLKKTIEKELSELGFKHVMFDSKVRQKEFTASGADDVAFYISPNAGEELKPLAEIVSSGEAARVMLALKKALIKVDPIPTLIFDEIDAQIGGRLGTVTGEKLRDISKKRQVLLITHLPQIASFADYHFKVSKTVQKGRTLTSVVLLDEKQRVDEIAKMMSGEQHSAISVKHAHDMLTKAGK